MPQAAAPPSGLDLLALAKMMQQFMPSKTPSDQYPTQNSSSAGSTQIPPNMTALQDILMSLMAQPKKVDNLNAPYGSNMRSSPQ